VSLESETMNKGIVGSAHWLPPEALGNPTGSDSDDKVPVGSKGDVWALGITAIEMAEGVPPNFELAPFQAMMKTLSDPPPRLTNDTKWSPTFQDFVARCLVKNPDDRPTAAQLLQDPFIIEHIVKPDVSVLAPLLASAEESERKSVSAASPSAAKARGSVIAPADKKEEVPEKDKEKEQAADESFLATHTIIIDDEDEDDFGSDGEDTKADESPKSKTAKGGAKKGMTMDDGQGSDLEEGDEFELNTQTIVADYD
jgi:serine/threonine protein kinase